jgi:hypothetical protein
LLTIAVVIRSRTKPDAFRPIPDLEDFNFLDLPGTKAIGSA